MEGKNFVTGFVGKVNKPLSIVVIGAGMGGLSAAARLAKVGHHVTVVEAADVPGGKCRREWIGRYAFDTGPTLLTLPAVYRDLFARTGRHLGMEIKLQSVDPSFDYRFADGKRIKFANLSRKQTLANIEEVLGEDASNEWDAILRRAEAMWDISRTPFIESELKSPLSLLKRPHLLRDFKVIAPHATLRDFAPTHSHLGAILDRYATYSGSDPRRAPAVLATIAFIEEAFGAWHVEGGLGLLAEKLHQRCESLGVTMKYSQRVDEILIDRNCVSGVRLAGGEEIAADVVISNADAGQTYSQLIRTHSRRTRRVQKNIAATQPSVAGFSILLGLRPGLSLEHHTVLFPADYNDEFASIFDRKAPAVRPAIYLCAPNDPTMVKAEGHQSVSILVNVPIHSVEASQGFDWSNKEFNRSYAASILEQIAEHGIPIHEYIDVMEIRTPLSLQESAMAPGGAIYGTSSNGPKAAFMRARNRSHIKNLYLVGGSSHPGGGLPLVALSGEMVYDAIMEPEQSATSSQSSTH